MSNRAILPQNCIFLLRLVSVPMGIPSNTVKSTFMDQVVQWIRWKLNSVCTKNMIRSANYEIINRFHSAEKNIPPTILTNNATSNAHGWRREREREEKMLWRDSAEIVLEHQEKHREKRKKYRDTDGNNEKTILIDLVLYVGKLFQEGNLALT